MYGDGCQSYIHIYCHSIENVCVLCNPQMSGLIILAAGIWAWNEKDAFSNLNKLTLLVLDPAFVLICIGSIAFLIGFTGSVGALRENTCLLGMVSDNNLSPYVKSVPISFLLPQFIVLVCVLLVVEICFGIMYLVLKDKGWVNMHPLLLSHNKYSTGHCG